MRGTDGLLLFVLKSHELFYSPKQIVLMKRVFVNLRNSALALGLMLTTAAAAMAADYPSVLIKVVLGQFLPL